VGRVSVGLLLPVFAAGYLAACGSTSRSVGTLSTATRTTSGASPWSTTTVTRGGLTMTIRCRSFHGDTNKLGACVTDGRLHGPVIVTKHKIGVTRTLVSSTSSR